MDDLSDTQIHVVWILSVVCGSLSIAGSLFILVSLVQFAELRTFSARLLVWLSVVNLIAPISQFQRSPTDSNCQWFAMLGQFFYVSSFLWTLCIAINLYVVVVLEAKMKKVKRLEKWYHLLSWGFPAFTLLMLDGSYGRAGAWCWIAASHGLQRLLCFYLPLLIVMLVSAVLYGCVVRRIHHKMHQGPGYDRSVDFEVNLNVSLFIVVFVVCRIWSCINRFQNQLDPDHPSFVLYVLHCLGASLQGFANTVVYVRNERICSLWFQKRTRLPTDSKREALPDAASTNASQSQSHVPAHQAPSLPLASTDDADDDDASTATDPRVWDIYSEDPTPYYAAADGRSYDSHSLLAATNTPP
eukprot:gnl/Spiro4/9562_TR5070_c0_g1_i1.p1 gnl/Spiro4/9562_TR5070_c0_g1~~gnl/Spiro4/9562_TR5070_c0_g1_i1.p1  ORF type:complete len:356 (+),score=82.73 gnl/Spiro4/9562_TR5070_c0_g1_i1:58-1125(+)